MGTWQSRAVGTRHAQEALGGGKALGHAQKNDVSLGAPRGDVRLSSSASREPRHRQSGQRFRANSRLEGWLVGLKFTRLVILV